MWQGDKLLVGLRAPSADTLAILVPIENPNEVIQGSPIKIGDPVTLDLGGMGVRSIEYVESTKKYYIVAGPWDRSAGFHLFSWSGERKDTPIELRTTDFANLNPEALFTFPGSTDLHVLSDDGKFTDKYGKKELECGKALLKGLPVHFRAITIPAQ